MSTEYTVEPVSEILAKKLTSYVGGEDIREVIESKDLMRLRSTRQVASRELLLDIYSYQDEERVRQLISEMALQGYNFGVLLNMATENHQWRTCEYLEAFHDLCRECIQQEKTELNQALTTQ